MRPGLPEPLARAATLDPDLLKTIAPEYFGGFKVVRHKLELYGLCPKAAGDGVVCPNEQRKK